VTIIIGVDAMLGTLQEAAFPHVLASLLLLGKGDTIMLGATLGLFILVTRIVTIAIPVQTIIGIVVPTIVALTSPLALENTASPLVLTDLGLRFKRLGLMLRAAQVLLILRARSITVPTICIPGRLARDGRLA
jgi:hypothetical protein